MQNRLIAFIFLLTTASFSASAADGATDNQGKKMRNKARQQQALAMLRTPQEMVQDDKYLYILRGPQLIKISKKDLSIDKQVLLLPDASSGE